MTPEFRELHKAFCALLLEVDKRIVEDLTDRALNAIEAERQAAIQDLWRPIEEAPKDGTIIYAYSKSTNRHYAPCRYAVASRFWGYEWWNERTGVWGPCASDPSHFMVPQPPKEEQTR